MSLTQSYFKRNSISFQVPKLSRKKLKRAEKKCGNCLHAHLVKTKPLNGLLNEYNCDVKKCIVLNCDGYCNDFINRWKHFLQPDKSVKQTQPERK